MKKEKIEKIKQLFKNKLFVNSLLITIFILFFVILNLNIKNNIYKINDRSFFAITYAKITNMPAIKINSNKVSYTDYFKFYDYLNSFYKKQNEKDQNNKIPSQESIKDEVISKLVKNSILKKLASKYDVSVNDREIFDEIKKLNSQTGGIDITEKIIRENYNMSLDEFKKDFLEPIIIKDKLNSIISNDSKINENNLKKITDIYDQIKESNNAVTTNKLGQKIDMFSTLARDLSEDSASSENYGDLGWLSRDSIEEPIKVAAFSLEKEQYSGVIKSSSGYHIIKLLDKIITIDIPKVRIAHIFIKSMDIDTYLQKDIKTAKIKIYIK